STFELKSLEKEKNKRENELKQLEKRKQKIEEEIAEKKAEAEYYQEVLALVQQERPDLIEKAVNNPEVEKLETDKIKPRVYIHIQDTSQADLAKRVKQALIELDFLVPDAKILVEDTPKNTQVRYFRKREQKEAGQLVNVLKEKFNIN
ncbi:MAG: hypothetical protein ACE5G1_04505, partial [bacterium]